MKLPKFNCRAVIICESFMMCSALAASVLMTKVEDMDKCSIDYIRYLVQQSCIRHLRERREDGVDNIRLDATPPHRFDLSHSRQLPRVPHHLLPKNITMSLIAKRKQKKHVKRDTEDHDVYFLFCCEHMEICENLDCP